MGNMHEKASVHAVCRSEAHGFSKKALPIIHLIEGEGVEGDAHRGTTVKHRSRVKRNPCDQLGQFQPGLMPAVLDRDESGQLIRKAGVMAVVLKGGAVSVGDEIRVAWPAEPHFALECV